MTSTRPANLHSIRGIMGCCHLLEDGEQSVMIDTGMVGEPFAIKRLVARLGLKPGSIKAILLTHGHLDHAGNLAWLKRWTGATVFGHRAEQSHVDGTYPYEGLSRWCGKLERVGRVLFRYRSAKIDEFVTDSQELPFWGGLKVVHLPGHTEGHCGFFSQKHDLLFSGDMFASYFFNVHRPAPILNSRPELMRESYQRMRALNARYLVPNHYDVLNPALHRRRFDQRVEGWVRQRNHPVKSEG